MQKYIDTVSCLGGPLQLFDLTVHTMTLKHAKCLRKFTISNFFHCHSQQHIRNTVIIKDLTTP